MFVFLGTQPFAWPMALVLSHCFGPGLWPRNPTLVPSLYLLGLASNLYLPALAFDLCLLVLAPKFVFTSPRLQFHYQSRAWVSHIPPSFPQFVLVFTALNYDLHYRSGAWFCIYLIIGSSSSGSCNSSSINFFGIDNTIICMPILVNQGKQTEVSTQTGC